LKPSAEEFERLALEQIDLLYRVARRLARDSDRASDLVQETYLRAFKARDSFELKEMGIRPWLVRILHNLHVTRADRDRRAPVSLDSESLERNESTLSAHGNLGFRDFELMDERLVRALNELPEENQVILLLWAVDELSYKEIADAVDVPLGTVMSRLHRSRQRLSQLLRQFALEEGVIRE
jgi:RNA polymerase sigma-70 factor (ECF subfamily)